MLAFEEEDTGKYTEVFSTEETLLVTTDTFTGDATFSDKDTDMEYNQNTSTFNPKLAKNMAKGGMGENETGITFVAELSDSTEEITDGKVNMETTTMAGQISINNDSKEDPLPSAGKNNPSSLPINGVSESPQVHEIGDKDTSEPVFLETNGLFEFLSENEEKTVKDDTYFIDTGFDLWEAGSTNIIYIDNKAHTLAWLRLPSPGLASLTLGCSQV
jgi:hypothetical protein